MVGRGRVEHADNDRRRFIRQEANPRRCRADVRGGARVDGAVLACPADRVAGGAGRARRAVQTGDHPTSLRDWVEGRAVAAVLHPKQISHSSSQRIPGTNEEVLRAENETIYPGVVVQARGGLKAKWPSASIRGVHDANRTVSPDQRTHRFRPIR